MICVSAIYVMPSFLFLFLYALTHVYVLIKQREELRAMHYADIE
jgi:hypothetical protein